MTTRAEMTRRKERVWETLHQRGPSLVSELVDDLQVGNYAGTWTYQKVRYQLGGLHREGRVNCWGDSGAGRAWITIPVEVPFDLIDQIERIADDAPFIRWVERAAHDARFRRETDPPPA
jgi:hypothetical protein